LFLRSIIKNSDGFIGGIAFVCVFISICLIAEFSMFPEDHGVYDPEGNLIPERGIFYSFENNVRPGSVQFSNNSSNIEDLNWFENMQLFFAKFILGNPVISGLFNALGTFWNMIVMFFRILSLDFYWLWCLLGDFVIVVKFPIWGVIGYSIIKALPLT